MACQHWFFWVDPKTRLAYCQDCPHAWEVTAAGGRAGWDPARPADRRAPTTPADRARAADRPPEPAEGDPIDDQRDLNRDPVPTQTSTPAHATSTHHQAATPARDVHREAAMAAGGKLGLHPHDPHRPGPPR
jgi:hypothetical protein